MKKTIKILAVTAAFGAISAVISFVTAKAIGSIKNRVLDRIESNNNNNNK